MERRTLGGINGFRIALERWRLLSSEMISLFSIYICETPGELALYTSLKTSVNTIQFNQVGSFLYSSTDVLPFALLQKKTTETGYFSKKNQQRTNMLIGLS